MGEIADERSSAGNRRQTKWGTGAGSETAWHARAESSTFGLVDGSIFLSIPFLFWAFSGATSSEPGFGALVAFGLLGSLLLRRASGLRLRSALELVAVPLVTATAAALTLFLWRTPVVGVGTAFDGSVRPWLVATACLIAVRLAFAASTPRRGVVVFSSAVDRVLKRTFDLVAASAILVVTAPVTVAVGLAIWVEDRGPIFYRGDRVGTDGQALRMLKFRKMRADADGPPLTASDDERFTRVGRFLVRWKLDELPQLWNVVKGEMSLVGPRPEDPAFVELYPGEFEAIARTRPGITGLCQLAFAKEAEILGGDDRVRRYTESHLSEKVKIDLLYVERRSFFYDLKILLWTALVLLRCDVAVHRQTGDLSVRRRRRSHVPAESTESS
jgi:lipopolysaccharide/colanic/teichoic acid biosynthesis glycosyltransferase